METTPEIKIKEVDRRFAIATKTAKAEERLRQERDTAVLASIKKGCIGFLLKPVLSHPAKSRIVFILDPENAHKPVQFCAITEDIPIWDIDDPNRPFDLMVNMTKNRNINRPIDVARSLAEFLQEFFPEAAKTNFKLYGSYKNYRKDKTLVEYLHPEEFISQITEMPSDKPR